ncbi:orotidine-5'-phosphate decarboxylase [Aliiglaciecola sp. CAU 1673]|uniref:orotidine-5'-phosphate decarboxylase n=1 Tax=Aliiglaciecola sp. CAU 1673 TaxID=3032595 RepID=UPI0023DC7982|nr:orotidine-5'-phosphate decarboxylase [Aliiglaciecola sp. CAU 1673]MDF2177650.1 orotidine-5'-phosphate decarboxylase [Aliiglaciecola sp. CAU 1673]
MKNDPKVVIALDFDSESKAMTFVDAIDPSQCRLKVGKEMFTYFGPVFVRRLIGKGFDVFLDLKFHDIPTTVAKACVAAADMGVWMVNLHASGGTKMMETSREALEAFGTDKPLLIAVTVLTSMSASDLSETGIALSPEQQVLHLAKLTQNAGLDGVVCSAQEASLLKSQLGQAFTLVTPGIRPAGSDKGDQQRIMTPEQAIAAGVDYMVIGRPITQAENPAQALLAINRSIGLA